MTDEAGMKGGGARKDETSGGDVREDGLPRASQDAAQPPAAPLSMPRQVLEARRGETLRAFLTRLLLPDA